MIGVTVLREVNPVIKKGDAPTCFVGIVQFDENVGVALYTIKLAVMDSAKKFVVIGCDAVMVVLPAPTIVTVLPDMVATFKFELEYTISDSSLFVVGGVKVKGLLPYVFPVT